MDFGNIMPGDQPGIPPMPQPQKRGGMFGGGAGNVLAAALAGFVSRRNPAILQGLMQMQMQKQRDQHDDNQYQRRLADQVDLYRKKQEIDAQYPTPPQPTEYERMLQAAGIQPGTPEYIQHVNSYVNMKENPVVMTPYGPMPYSGVMGSGQAPARPVGKLTPIDGGPTPQASGGFPPVGY